MMRNLLFWMRRLRSGIFWEGCGLLDEGLLELCFVWLKGWKCSLGFFWPFSCFCYSLLDNSSVLKSSSKVRDIGSGFRVL